MNAVVCTRYGPPEVLQLQEVAKPEPEDNEVLIKVHASVATTAGLQGRKGEPYFARLFTGFSKPKKNILGMEFTGEIVAVGKDVTSFKKGEQVFGHAGLAFGAYAEYICLPDDAALLSKPQNMTYEESVAVMEGGLTALHFFRGKGEVKPGQKVLVNGASGSVGTAAVQLAKHFGAEVTGVCSAANVDLVTSLGADKVIDYTHEDFTRHAQAYDIIFDTVGKSSFVRSRNALTQNGVYLDSGNAATVLPTLWTSVVGRKKAVLKAAYMRSAKAIKQDLTELKELVEAGKIRAVIDRCYPLEQTAEAQRYVETGRKKGNVVISGYGSQYSK